MGASGESQNSVPGWRDIGGSRQQNHRDARCACQPGRLIARDALVGVAKTQREGGIKTLQDLLDQEGKLDLHPEMSSPFPAGLCRATASTRVSG